MLLGLPWNVVSLFVICIGGQLVGIALLSKTEGLTNIPYALAYFLAMAIGLAALTRLVHGGFNISILIPIMATVIPLVSVAIGIMIYHEAASPARIGLLLGACVLIGVAAKY